MGVERRRGMGSGRDCAIGLGNGWGMGGGRCESMGRCGLALTSLDLNRRNYELPVG